VSNPFDGAHRSPETTSEKGHNAVSTTTISPDFTRLKDAWIKPRYRNLIGGEWVDGLKGETFDVYCPANGQHLATVTKADPEDVDRAVEAAWKAFPTWKRTSLAERAAILTKLADLLEEHADELAWIESLECGRPFNSTRFSIGVPIFGGAIQSFRYYAGAILTQEGVTNVTNDHTINMIIDEPIGVVAGITAWNAPMVMNAMKFPPALAAGCTIVYRPSSIAPLATLRFAEILQEVLPAGVVNVVTGPATTTGQHILEHSGIRKISFTGSAETGREVARAAGGHLATTTLELGGDSAQIFFPDLYDMDVSLQGVLMGSLNWAGQQCAHGTRLFVHEDIHDEFVAKMVAAFENYPVGMPWDLTAQMGAMSSESQMNKVLSYIEIGRQEGATVATGGYRMTDGEFGNGYFVKPTLFVDATNDMRCVREEIFGPVAEVIKFRTEEEVIAMANDNDLGLAGGVWSKDISRALRVAQAVDTGTMWVNTYEQQFVPFPWVGRKNSGWGVETNREAIREFTRRKSIVINTDNTSLFGG
jgi:acyl-CoA reductase-like NAD-dependent aldehyde dehydrogenase